MNVEQQTEYSHQPWIGAEGVDLLPGGREATQLAQGAIIPLDETISLWGEIIDAYKDFRFNENTANVVVEIPEIKRLLNNGAITDKKLLEVGAGLGWFVDQLFRIGNPEKVVALEPSDPMREYMVEKLKDMSYSSRVEFSDSPIEQVEYDQEFDVVVAINVLDVISDLRTGLENINRALPLGGKLIGMVRHPDRNELMALKGTGDYVPGYKSWYYEYWPGNRSGIWSRYMKYSQWNNELVNAGFLARLYEPHVPEIVKETHPDIWEIYSRRPGALIISATKIADVQ